jgi:signal transduction histidine kinase/DNA-binding response OmpR family regulator
LSLQGVYLPFVTDEFCGLLDPSGFVPRAVCGRWTQWEIMLNNVSDLLIALAYVLIPIILVYFTRRRRDLPFSWMFLVFGAFIVSCGCTHILEIVLFYYPVYHLAGWLKALTALASWAAVLCLIKIAPTALRLRSPSELEREIECRRKAESELAEKNRRLEAAEQLKDQFLANVSHELRTPLTLILSPTESLLGSSQTPATQRPTLELIRSNSLRLLQQVNDLLDYSRYQSGKLEVDRQSTEVVGLSRQLVASFEPLAQQRGIDLQFAAEAEQTRWLDQYLYERILFNLLSNALKFARQRVQVEIGFSQDRLWLKVSDDGPGVPVPDRQRIFERFQQGQSFDRQSGTGLGLALVREFCSVLGGQVEILEGPVSCFLVQLLAPLAQLPGRPPAQSSNPHRHTEFATTPVLDWPPATPSVGAQPLHSDKLLGGRPRRLALQGLPRVLLVEDEPDLAGYMALVLQGVAEVRSVRDGSLALAEVESWQPELVLSDVMMPINLLVNALKFTNRGSVLLQVDSRLTFSVVDTGEGISAVDQARIFERFAQADESLKRTHQGLGLGLAICTELLQIMGAQLQLSSQPGQGSRFWFQLKLPQAQKPTNQLDSEVSRRYKLLLVEDHPLNRAALRVLLEQAGQYVATAESGIQALDLVDRQAFDVAVLDLQLPDMDGFEIASAIRQRQPRLPLLALTAHAGEEWRNRCLKAGFKAFLTKPVDPAELLRVITDVYAETIYTD